MSERWTPFLMNKYAAVLELMPPEEIQHALHFVEVMERAGHMDAEEAEGWRRWIEAWQLPTLSNRRIREAVPPRQPWFVLGTPAVGCCPWTLLAWITTA